MIARDIWADPGIVHAAKAYLYVLGDQASNSYIVGDEKIRIPGGCDDCESELWSTDDPEHPLFGIGKIFVFHDGDCLGLAAFFSRFRVAAEQRRLNALSRLRDRRREVSNS